MSKGNTGKRFTELELIEDLKRLHTAYGKVGIKEVREYGLSTPETYRNRFGSLNSAKVKAGLTIAPKGRPRNRRPLAKVESVAEAAANILAMAGSPMTAAQIANQLKARPIVDISVKYPRKKVLYALTHNQKFKKVSEGTYTLSE